MDEFFECGNCNEDLGEEGLFVNNFNNECERNNRECDCECNNDCDRCDSRLTYTIRTLYNFNCTNDAMASILSNLSSNNINVVSINLNEISQSRVNVKMVIGGANKEIPCQRSTFEQMLRDYGISYGKGCAIEIVSGLTQKVMANLYKILSPTCCVKSMAYGLNSTLFISCVNMKLADQLVSCFAKRV